MKATINPETMNGYLAEMNKSNCLNADYWRKTTGAIAILANGGYLAIDKSRIETDFCFGYDTDYTGHEASDAEAARAAFAASAEAFKAANLRDLDERIENLRTYINDPLAGRCFPSLQRVQYYGQSEPLNVWRIGWHYWYEAQQHPGMSKADAEKVIEALQAERANFDKRLDTYLKRYGTSKLHTLTYWRD